MTFESLLVKELQKQQSKAEFCDIVLQTQGVSVPVHSCVLSAFSPWLRGALSAMPSLRTGQKQLIEVQAIESCTLLGLVTLMYSGQLNEDKQEVLSAACKLGINIPQQITTDGSKGQENEAEKAAPGQKCGSQAGTQTTYTKLSVERECQTEVVFTASLTLPSEYPQTEETVETVNVSGLSSWRSNQGLGSYVGASDITLTALQNVQGIPEKLPSFQVMNVAPESSVYPTVSAPACVPQQYEIPPESLSAPMPPHPYSSYGTCVGPLAIQGQSALEGVSQGQEYDLGLEQFENNIPGFINYFLNANSTQGAEQRAQSQRGMRGENKIRGRVKRVRQARVQGDSAAGWEGWNIRKTNQNMHRFGRVAQSVWIGQGGGRVGRTLDTRQVLKHQGRHNRRQGRGAIYKVEGERGRSSSRARPRKRQAERVVEPVFQNKAPPVRRTRGRPRKRPLPLPNAAQSEISASVQKASNPSASFLMHTAALPASNQTDLAQPMDWLIDDVIAQLPFMPPISSGIQNNQDGIMSTATLDSHPPTQTTVKLTDLDITQPQPEGELTDILDSFLRTFDQHVGPCDGMPDGSHSSVTDADQQSAQNPQSAQIATSNTHTRNDSCYPSRTSFRNTTTPQGPKSTLPKNRPQVSVCRPRKPPFGGMKKKFKGCQSGKSETCRMTRSQSRKRGLENPQDMQWRDELPAKRRRRKKQELKEQKGEISPQNDNKTQLYSENRRKIDSNCNVASALRKVMTLPSACRVKCCAQSTITKPKTLDGSQSSDLCGHKESCFVKNQACHTKRDSLLKMDQSTASVSSQSDQSVTNTFTGSHPETALSAFELMKNLLENQRKREEEQNKHDHRRRTPKRRREKGKSKLRRGAKRARPCNQTTSPYNALAKGEGERLIKNSYNKPADTDDPCTVSLFPSTLSESSDSSCAMVHSTEVVTLTNITAMPCVSHAIDPDIPLKDEYIQCSADISEEDVDVVEISSSFSETTTVFPVIADIVPSTEEEEVDDEEEAEIDVLDSD